MKKYRLKNQFAQMTLDALTNGEFTKELNEDIEFAITRHGSIEQKEDDCGYVLVVVVKPSFARKMTVELRCKDLEEVTE